MRSLPPHPRTTPATRSVRLRATGLLALALVAPLLSSCSLLRRPYRPDRSTGPGTPFEQGVASWYGPGFHGRRTASGERFNQNELTAAHRTLPFGTRLLVTNLDNGRTATVRVNDRGPFAKNRVIDLSYGAAKELGVVGPGTAEVALSLLDGPPEPVTYTVQLAAFGDAERAKALRDSLNGTFPETVVRSDGVWHRVQIGAFEDRKFADDLLHEISALGLTGFVVAR